MIGGDDLVINTNNPNAIHNALAAIGEYWPSMLIECVETGKFYNSAESVPNKTEVFTYPNIDAFKKWDELGVCEETKNSMIQILSGDNSITFVADDWHDPVLQSLADSLKKAVQLPAYSKAKSHNAYSQT